MLTLNIFHTFFSVSIVDFEQVNVYKLLNTLLNIISSMVQKSNVSSTILMYLLKKLFTNSKRSSVPDYFAIICSISTLK